MTPPHVYQYCPQCKFETKHYLNDDYQVLSCLNCGYLDFTTIKKKYPNPSSQPGKFFK